MAEEVAFDLCLDDRVEFGGEHPLSQYEQAELKHMRRHKAQSVSLKAWPKRRTNKKKE